MQYEIPVRDRKIKYHTQKDLDRFFMMLYTTGPPRDYALFSLMVYFGLRTSEVGLIGFDHIDLNRHRIWITRLKSGSALSIPYPARPDLSESLKAYLDLSCTKLFDCFVLFPFLN